MSRRRFLGQVDSHGRVRDAFRDAATAFRSDLRAGSWVDVDDGHQTLRAEAGTALAELWDLVLTQGLDPVFPPSILAEVEALEADSGIDDPTLRDLTHLPFVTIDDASSRDLDQAVFVEEDADGFLLWYAIADASFYVKPGSALFARSLQRGASFYLPGFALPMLPPELSEGLVSLNPNVDRRASVFCSRVLPSGKAGGTEITRARIRSRGKLSFERVQAFLDGTSDEPAPGTAASLRALERVGEVRMFAASERGVARYRRSEVNVKLVDGGRTFVALGDLRNDVERYNEQCSLLCNLEGARVLTELDRPDDHVHPIYRVHRPPEPERLAQLSGLVDELVALHGLPDLWRWADDEPIAAWLARLPSTGDEGRIARALHRQAVMVNVASTYEPEPGPHHGVGGEAYARFSAPMREVVGIFSHQELWEALGEGFTDDEGVRDEVLASANRAKSVQRAIDRDCNRLVLDARFATEAAVDQASRSWSRGTLMGATRSRLHVTLDEPPIDVKVYTQHLGDVDVEGMVVRKSGERWLCVGDAVEVRVAGVDPGRDRWQLDLRKVG